MTSKPQVHRDEIDWLISVYKSSDNEELRIEALEKLQKFGFDKSQINERFKNINSEKKEFEALEKAWEKQKERNQYERYSKIEKLKIFLFGPYELFKMYNSGLTDLYKDNYKIKFRQRLILLITGTAFWILLCVAGYRYFEYKRMQEIEKTDISNWENNRQKNK